MPACAESTATDCTVRPRVAAAPSSASVIVTPLNPSSLRSKDWIRGDQGAGFESSAGYDAFEIMTIGTPAAIAARNGARSRSSALRLARISTSERVGVARRPADPREVLRGRGDPAQSASPRANAVTARPTTAPDAPNVLSSAAMNDPGARHVRHRREIDVDPAGPERTAGEERLPPDARRARLAELGRALAPARPTGGGGHAPPSWSVAIRSGGRPAARAALCSSAVSARSWAGLVMLAPKRMIPPTSPRRMRPRSAGDGRVPCIATMSRWPTSSARRRGAAATAAPATGAAADCAIATAAAAMTAASGSARSRLTRAMPGVRVPVPG